MSGRCDAMWPEETIVTFGGELGHEFPRCQLPMGHDGGHRAEYPNQPVPQSYVWSRPVVPDWSGKGSTPMSELSSPSTGGGA